MRAKLEIKGIYRIIDANTNRAKEGLRVCEEVARFILNNRSITANLKTIRHALDKKVRRLVSFKNTLCSRDSIGDIGAHIYGNELSRQSYLDIYFASMQRVKESIRVLEEFAKLKDKRIAVEFKRLRYSLYTIEKKSAHAL